jgi:Fungal hydrophobin
MLRQAVLVALATLSLVTATTTIKCAPPKKTWVLLLSRCFLILNRRGLSRSPIPIKQCNTGHAQCCDSVTHPTEPQAAAMLGLLGVVVQGVDVLVG